MRFVESPYLYILGTLGAAGLAYAIFGDRDTSSRPATQTMSPATCAMILRGAPRDLVVAAVNVGAGSVNPAAATAGYFEAHGLPNVGACVRKDPAMMILARTIAESVAKVASTPPVTPLPPTPVPPPTPAPPQTDCAPTTAIQLSYDVDVSFTDIAMNITGDPLAVADLDKIPESDTFYRYVVTQPILSMGDNVQTPIETVVDVDHARSIAYPFTAFAADPILIQKGLVHPTGTDATPDADRYNTTAVWLEITGVRSIGRFLRANRSFVVPAAWNPFFVREADGTFVVPAPGVTHPACAPTT